MIFFVHYIGLVNGVGSSIGLTQPEETSTDRATEELELGVEELPDLPQALNPSLDWRQRAATHKAGKGLSDEETAPLIALVMDDMGLSERRDRRVLDLGVPLTISLLPYGRNLQVLADDANRLGHDVLVHVPMQPDNDDLNPGRMSLRVDHSNDDVLARLTWNLSQFAGYVGINNHMGSRFSTDQRRLTLVLQDIQRRGLIMLDSLTSPDSLIGMVGGKVGALVMDRDIFIDASADSKSIAASFAQTESVARKRGWVIAIAHPLPITLGMLEVWIKEAQRSGMRFTTISQLASRLLPSASPDPLIQSTSTALVVPSHPSSAPSSDRPSGASVTRSEESRMQGTQDPPPLRPDLAASVVWRPTESGGEAIGDHGSWDSVPVEWFTAPQPDAPLPLPVVERRGVEAMAPVPLSDGDS